MSAFPAATRATILTGALLLFHASAGWSAQVVALVNGSRLEVESYRMEGPRIIFTLSGGGEIGFSPQQVSGITSTPAAPSSPIAGAPGGSPAPATRPNGGGEPALLGPAPTLISPWDPEPGVRALIGEIAGTQGLDVKLVGALVEVESKFDPYAVSRRGAMGLMQLMPATARRYGVENVFDPRQNLEGGMRYLKYLLARYDNIPLALAAYNAGEDVVDRYRGIPPFQETRGYVARILKRLKS